MARDKDFNPAKPIRNLRQERFCLAYIRLDGNAARAYQEAYRQRRAQVAAVDGFRTLRYPHIQARINYLRTQAFKREHMGAEEVLREMARIGRVDLGDVIWKTGERDSAGNETVPGTRKPLHELPQSIRRCVKSIKLDEDGRWELTFWNKDHQLTNIAQHHKLLADSGVTVNIQLGFSERLRAAREKRLKES